MFYYLLSFFWNTRAMDLILGLGALLLVLAAVNWLKLPVLQRMVIYLGNVALIALVIIFQPELRLALAKLSVKGKSSKRLQNLIAS